MGKKLRQIVINGSDPYELKDQLIDQVVTSTTIGNSTTATDIKKEIETAVTGTTASSSGMTIKEALTALKNSITGKDVGVTNVSADTSTTGKIILKQSKNGGAAQAITNAEIGTATLTIQKNSTNVATFGANASSNVTANIEVPTKTSDLTNDGSGTKSGTNYLTTVQDVKSLIEDARFATFDPVTYNPGDPSSQGWGPGKQGIIYLYNPDPQDSDSNIYEEWIWIGDSSIDPDARYEKVGTTEADLTNYAKKDGNNDFTGTNTFRNVTINGADIGNDHFPGYLTIGNTNSGIILNGGFNTITDSLTGETLKDVLDGKLDKNVNDTLGGGTASTHVVTTVGQYHDIVGSNNGFAWIKDGSNVTLESRLTAISGDDKLKGYGYISVSVSNTNGTGKFSPTTSSYTAPGASSATTGTVYSNIQRAVTNSQLPILSLSLTGLTSTIPVVMYNNMETGSIYFGQAILRKGVGTSQSSLHDYYITVESTSSATTVIISEPVSATYNTTNELLSITIPFADSVTYGYAPATVAN